MSRSNLSTRAIKSALAHESQDAFILLFTFTVPGSSPVVKYRAANNTEDVLSNGNLFTACFFNFAFPPDDEEAPKGVSISIDNVDLRLVGMLRSVTDPIPCQLDVAIAATPNVIEMSLPDLLLVEVTWNEQTIQAQLASDDPLNLIYPAHVYEPRTFPGVF